MTIKTRRFNIGNMDREATVTMTLDETCDVQESLKRFLEVANDVTDLSKGSIEIPPVRIIELDEEENHRAQARAHRIRGALKQFDTPESLAEEAIIPNEMPARKARVRIPQSEPSREVPEVFEIEELKEIHSYEMERQRDLVALRMHILSYIAKYHNDRRANPNHLMQEMLTGKYVPPMLNSVPSDLLENNDLKIILPNYDEVEVKMPAMCRTLYFLFLKHPEGIELRNLGDYRDELEEIYAMVMPNRRDDLAKQAIDRLLDPTENTVNEKLSRIKRCFLNKILDKDMAEPYFVSGSRGGRYGVKLSPEQIHLPRAFTA